MVYRGFSSENILMTFKASMFFAAPLKVKETRIPKYFIKTFIHSHNHVVSILL